MSFAWGDRLPTISAPRVDLRWMTRDDAPALLEVFGDTEVMRFWSSPPLADLQAAQQLVDEIQDYFHTRKLFQWGVQLRGSPEVIGTGTLYDIDERHRRGGIGFALRRSVWGQGFATETIEALLRFSFERLDLHRMEADVDPENVRSLRALERQGFKREGYLRERWHHLGELRDTVFLGLLRREWPAGESC